VFVIAAHEINIHIVVIQVLKTYFQNPAYFLICNSPNKDLGPVTYFFQVHCELFLWDCLTLLLLNEIVWNLCLYFLPFISNTEWITNVRKSIFLVKPCCIYIYKTHDFIVFVSDWEQGLTLWHVYKWSESEKEEREREREVSEYGGGAGSVQICSALFILSEFAKCSTRFGSKLYLEELWFWTVLNSVMLDSYSLDVILIVLI